MMFAAYPAPAPAADVSARVRHRWVVGAILTAALALRLWIVAQGGALYWTDEKRYLVARDAAAALAEGDMAGAAHFLLSTSDHIGFRWLALAPAALERAVFGAEPPHARLGAGFFALFGVANLFLIWRIARRLAPDDVEPLLALAFAASSNALFFFSRHCFPYDAALTFFLGATLVSVGERRRGQSLIVGALCGLGYLTYNGYWSVGAVILLLHVAWGREIFSVRARRAAWAFLGVGAPVAVCVGAARACGYNLVAHARSFADTVNQGDFGGGWRLALEYLPITDGALAIGLFAAVLAGTVAALLRHKPEPWLRWVGALALLFALWIALADGVQKFTLYGRTVRAAVPFLALAAAGAIGFFRRTASADARRWWTVGSIALCAAGLAMMRAPLGQMFPAEFRPLAEAVKTEAARREPTAVFRTLFADYLYDYHFPEPPPAHRELLRQPHPHRYLPYLYEGYTRAQRPRYMAHDTAMRLVQLDTSQGLQLLKKSADAAALSSHPGPLAIRFRLPRQRAGNVETLLTHGDDPAQRDRLTLHYLDANRLRLGLQHGTTALLLSEIFSCGTETEHTLTLSLGSFWPATAAEPATRAVVRFDGQPAIDDAFPAHPAPLSALRVGAGIPPGESTFPFSGEIRSIRQRDPRAVNAEFFLAKDSPPIPPVLGPFFGDHHGTVEISLRFPADAVGKSEPLLASGRSGAGDLLFVRYLDGRRVVLGVDHWGSPSLQSEPITLAPGDTHRLTVSFGSLFPPPDDARYAESPHLRLLGQWLFVQLDGQTVFSRAFDFFRAGPDDVQFAHALAGGTASDPAFTGNIVAIRRVAPEAAGLEERTLRGPKIEGALQSGGFPGTLRLEVQLPPAWDPGTEPLLITGDLPQGDLVFVRFRGSRQIQLGYRHGGGPMLLSRPLPTAPGASHTIDVSIGSLYPEAEGPDRRSRVRLAVDGVTLLDAAADSHAAPPSQIFFGTNPTGAKGVRAAFAGKILSVRTIAAP